MKFLQLIIKRAENSTFYRWILNQALWRVIPFNLPHKVKVIAIDENDITIRLPYIRRNLNHLNGLHACALATLCEYACGLKLVQWLGADNYRIIMQKMEMNYIFQGKSDAFVKFRFTQEQLNEINVELSQQAAVTRTFELKVFDTREEHLCTALVTWQIKDWKKVKTR